ncbi:MAG TPA: hypothetical protein DCS33_09610 [Gammaproteobacteria bacterium]|nr:prepilin-type N-terminal cleavage/methylation domain-containing protein [Gammaproteobacteria bacterium]HAS49524.1 hypothetical protein [Gammaproteobacteria bacterium]
MKQNSRGFTLIEVLMRLRL